MQLLLQILEDGRLTDSLGRTVDFRNTIIIMTSGPTHRTSEFLNRLDDLIVFRMLEKPDLAKIVDLEIKKVTSRVAKKQIAPDASRRKLRAQ
jgi:ATP-dependent Clp protease ATP-binding subunit ClpA